MDVLGGISGDRNGFARTVMRGVSEGASNPEQVVERKWRGGFSRQRRGRVLRARDGGLQWTCCERTEARMGCVGW